MRVHAVTTKRAFRWTGLVVLAVLIGFTRPTVTQVGSVGSFEIDGNLVDDPPGEPIDWSTDPAGNIPHPSLFNRLDFRDGSGQGDDIFGQGTKELDPGEWRCVTGSAPGKDDVPRGSVGLQAVVYGEAAIIHTDSPLQLHCPESAYLKTRASTAISSELKDRTAPLKVVFGDHPELANASKSAFGVFVSALGISQKVVEVSSSQQGVGSTGQE